MTSVKTVLTIAGSDSSGGAGIQADIKIISALGCHAASVITALTAQNTQCVKAIHPVPSEFVAQQIDTVFEDLSIDAIKIGMLYNLDICKAVRDSLLKWRPKHVVLDPVMVATSNAILLQENTINYLKEFLFPLATLITPNIPEAERLLEISINSTEDMKFAAQKLSELCATNTLIKGGHLNESEQCTDILFKNSTKQFFYYTDKRIITTNSHGTGCTLASAIASNLAMNKDLSVAIDSSKKNVRHYILSGLQRYIKTNFGSPS